MGAGQILVGLFVLAVIAYVIWYYYLSPEGKAYQAVKTATNACNVSRVSGLVADETATTVALTAALTAITAAAASLNASITINPNGTLTLTPVTASTRLAEIIATYNLIACLVVISNAGTPPTTAPPTTTTRSVTLSDGSTLVVPANAVYSSHCDGDSSNAGATCPSGQNLTIYGARYWAPTGGHCGGPGGCTTGAAGADFTSQVQGLVHNGQLSWPGNYHLTLGDTCSGYPKAMEYYYTCS